MTRPVFRLRQVQKSYAGRCVLDIDALEVYAGEILAIVGPSGAGKSTLLRLLNFLEYPDSGELYYEGALVSPALGLEARRSVTTVFQRPALLRDNVERNVAYGLRLRGKRSPNAETQQLLARLGLQKLRRAPAHNLSGGEAQRVALARALVLRPAVLLLDEPTANLDPYNIKLIEAVIREENEGHHTSMVLVTHNIFQARRLAHRVALMLDGRIVESAQTSQFFDAPQDPRTRAFVAGEMVY